MKNWKYVVTWKEYQLKWTPDRIIHFQCPMCGKVGCIDQEQYNGQVSIECGPPCKFEETVNLRKLEVKP